MERLFLPPAHLTAQAEAGINSQGAFLQSRQLRLSHLWLLRCTPVLLAWLRGIVDPADPVSLAFWLMRLLSGFLPCEILASATD